LFRHLGWRRGGRLRLHDGWFRDLRCFTRRESIKPLGRQLLRLGVNCFGRRTVKGNTLVIARYGLAVDWRNFLANKDAELVRMADIRRDWQDIVMQLGAMSNKQTAAVATMGIK
jgi:hypothetical protein